MTNHPRYSQQPEQRAGGAAPGYPGGRPDPYQQHQYDWRYAQQSQQPQQAYRPAYDPYRIPASPQPVPVVKKPSRVALTAGAVVSMVSGILLVRWLGGGDVLERTMAPKAVTTPVTIELTHRLGGYPELSAAFAIVIGIVAAMIAPRVLTLLRIRDPRARGIAVGAVSHGIGTARMLEESRVEGAFSGLAMGLTAVVTCLLVPLVAYLLL